MLGWAVLGCLLTVLVGSARADGSAAELHPDCASPRRISLLLPPDWDQKLAEDVTTDLSTELVARSIGVCSNDPGQGNALAEVRLSTSRPAAVRIELTDHLTNKNVTRTISLVSVPADGRALTIALAVDELLRASWAELSWTKLTLTPSSVESDSEHAMTALAHEVANSATRDPRTRLSLEPSLLGRGRDYLAIGTLVTLGQRVLSSMTVSLSIGGAHLFPQEVEGGELRGATLLTEARVGHCTSLRSQTLSLCGALGPLFELLFARGRPDRGYAAKKHILSLLSLHASVELISKLSDQAFLSARLSGGYSVLGKRLQRDSETVLRFEGPSYGASIGAGMWL